MLKVELDKILSVTEARAKIATVVDDVAKGNVYVLTKGGKPIVLVTPIDFMDKKVTKKNSPVEAEIEESPIEADTEPENLSTEEETKLDTEELPTGIDLDKVEQALADTAVAKSAAK